MALAANRRRRRMEKAFALALAMEAPLNGGNDGPSLVQTLTLLQPVDPVPLVIIVIQLLLSTGALMLSVGRQLWTAHPQNEFGEPGGFWEAEVLGTWEDAGQESEQHLKTSWMTHFRMEKRTFRFLLRQYGHLLVRQSTHLRRTVPAPKRLGILLYYLCHGETFSEVAALFQVGTSTVAGIVHDFVEALVGPITAENIVFPTGKQLQRTMARFEALCGLPMCFGAVDSTFVRMVKPERYGDSFWCYKQHSAVILFACVDARGIFTYVDVGAPGNVGDAHVYNNSDFKRKVEAGTWGNFPIWQCHGQSVRPYVVGDSAFTLSPILMKIFPGNLTPEQESFNRLQIRTRRVVECAFGRLKEQFAVVSETTANDPMFVSKIALLCCGLHNILERRNTGFLPCYRNHAPVPLVAMHPSPHVFIRNALAQYAHAL